MECRGADGLNTVAAVRGLSLEQSRENIPVHLRGVVTFFDESLYSHFIQDDTAGIYFRFPLNVAPPLLEPGQTIELTGVSSPGEYAPVVLVSNVAVVGSTVLPPARPVAYEQLASGVEDSQFVEVQGVVRSIKAVDNPSIT